MPIVSTVCDPNGRITTTVAGQLDARDLFDLQKRVAACPGLRHVNSALIDLTDVIEVSITAREVEALSIAQLFAPTVRRAIVAPVPVTYGLSRMFELFTDGRGQVQVFRDRGSAEQWLDGAGGPSFALESPIG